MSEITMHTGSHEVNTINIEWADENNVRRTIVISASVLERDLNYITRIEVLVDGELLGRFRGNKNPT